jgi:ABC-2 type transport system permease protein
LAEWKHFARSPFKLVAFGLFIAAAVYGLHNGARLYHTQSAEIERIQGEAEEMRTEQIAFFESETYGPEERPWINLQEPFWAVWYSGIYHFKEPSACMVYNTGQAEQYGFYKRVTFWASPYDADMTKELANPERLQLGRIDFAFALLYLLPLLLVVLLHDIKGSEAEQGALPLIMVQAGGQAKWLWGRVLFYGAGAACVLFALLLYGTTLTPVWANASSAFAGIAGLSLLVLLGWTVLFGLVLNLGHRILGNSIVMLSFWLLIAFVLPGVAHHWAMLSYPTDLMTDFIDAQREDREELFAQSDTLLVKQLVELYPTLRETPIYQDSLKRIPLGARSSYAALANALVKDRVRPMEEMQQHRNLLLRSMHAINPMALLQNRMNSLCGNHFQDYQIYRSEVQERIDRQLSTMVHDSWNEVVVDRDQYLKYTEMLQ